MNIISQSPYFISYPNKEIADSTDKVFLSFKKGLNNWLNDPSVTGQKNVAYKRIIDAYENNKNSLILCWLDLNSLPPEIAQLTQLDTLDISNNNLQSLPLEIVKLTKLEKLNLYKNQMQTLPPEIAQLTQLTKLHISNNQLQSLPPEIGKLTLLTTLGICNNQLQSLPPEIGKLTLLKELDISNNQLQSLPPEIIQLTLLTRLGISNNQLQSLPAEIGQLTQIKELNMSGNELQSLPPEIGQLTQLISLILFNNQLQSLPPEIGQLTLLKELDISNNQLQSLPASLGNLLELKDFTVCNNPDLQELPMSLGNIQGITFIDTTKTKIPEQTVNDILGLCRSKRKKQALEILPKRLKLWNGINPHPVTLDLEKAGLNEEQKIALNEWLVRLEKASDFSRHQKELSETVCNILEHVFQNEEFRETFFNQISANLECCQDRAAMALNEIYTSYMLSKLSKDASVGEKLKIIEGCAKTFALRREISKLIVNRQKELGNIELESVQIFLYWEKELKDLPLVTAIQTMTYEVIGKRDWIKKEYLMQVVEETYLDMLIDIPAFQEIIKTDKDYENQLKEKVKSINDKMDKLNKEKPQPEDLLSEDYLNWSEHMGQLQQKFDVATKQVQKEWVQKS